MCGRYVQTHTPEELCELFGAVLDRAVRTLRPDHNVAPTRDVPAVVWFGERTLTALQWGLVPPWAKDPRIGARMINARVETAAEKPSFRRAFRERRCLLPADGFYEWTQEGKAKQPWVLRPEDGEVLAFAGLHETWSGPGAETLRTATILTTEAVDTAGRVHERMPVILPPTAWDQWLDPDLTDPQEVMSILTSRGAPALELVKVGRNVNSVRNNGPELLAPV